MAKRTIKTSSAKKKATAVKAAPAATTAKTAAKTAPAPKVNAHSEAGLQIGMYTGPSSMINANRKARVMLTEKRTTDSLSERMQKSLYALRKTYGGKRFTAKGFDNGILRDLNAAGLISLSGGNEETSDGKTYMVDGEQPLVVTITKAGQDYGQVSAS